MRQWQRVQKGRSGSLSEAEKITIAAACQRLIDEVLVKNRKDPVTLSLDTTSIKAHRSASGGKGGSAHKRSAARGAGARPKSMR